LAPSARSRETQSQSDSIDVGIAGAECDLAGLGARELGDLQRQVGLLVETARADRRQFQENVPVF